MPQAEAVEGNWFVVMKIDSKPSYKAKTTMHTSEVRFSSSDGLKEH